VVGAVDIIRAELNLVLLVVRVVVDMDNPHQQVAQELLDKVFLVGLAYHLQPLKVVVVVEQGNLEQMYLPFQMLQVDAEKSFQRLLEIHHILMVDRHIQNKPHFRRVGILVVEELVDLLLLR
jgi:hypothetical protein